MIGRTNRPESEITRRIEAVRTSKETTFRGLLDAGEFDVRSELRFRNLAGLSFAGDDLRGIDFTGANLSGCDFSGALIVGARFDRARLGRYFDNAHADLSRAADWQEYAGSSSRELTLKHRNVRDSHIATWDVFMDAPELPVMVALPVLFDIGGKFPPLKVAVSYHQIGRRDFEYFDAALAAQIQDDEVDWNDAQRYVSWAQSITGLGHRFFYHDEWLRVTKAIGDSEFDRFNGDEELDGDDDEDISFRGVSGESDESLEGANRIVEMDERHRASPVADWLKFLFPLNDPVFWGMTREDPTGGDLLYRSAPETEFSLTTAPMRLVRPLV